MLVGGGTTQFFFLNNLLKWDVHYTNTERIQYVMVEQRDEPDEEVDYLGTGL